ncbi:MAG TPA: YjbE family putative metal transport protein [Ktedonobacteraceae bacterium]|nr:YjbE family putative metal transport protein [Ktedonobacteraceae bacterium]
MISWLPILGSIVLIDLILSGDNALVIGAVAARLPISMRWAAFLFGGGGAIALRISLTYPISLLLQFPILEAVGGIFLLAITAQLLLHQDDPAEKTNPAGQSITLFNRISIKPPQMRRSLLLAMLTIIVADATTSLDNIIAVAALAKGNQLLLIFGLLFSITFLLIASALVSAIIERLPWMILVAAIILTITAADLVVQEKQISTLLAGSLWGTIAIYIAAFAIIIPFGYVWVRRQVRKAG